MARYVIGAAAARNGGKVALEVVTDAAASRPAEAWTYAEIEDAVLRTAAALLARGLEPGDRLMIRMPNESGYAILFFGAIAAGLVPIPTSSQLTAAEAQFILEDSGARAIAIAPDLPVERLTAGVMPIESEEACRMRDWRSRADYRDSLADDPAYMVYTSGTTSRPKGVQHAQRAAWGRRPMYAGWYGLGASDRMLHTGAFNWTYTLGTGLTDPWANGATCIIYTGEKDPALWPRLIAGHCATIFAAVPGLYRQILKYAAPTRESLANLRHGLIAGEAMPPALFEEWRERTGRILYEALGMSELSTFVSSSPVVPPRPGAVGRPQAGRAVAIIPLEGGTDPLPPGEHGLLAAHRSDPGLMLGYWQRPEEERQVLRGEWFIGGDVCSMDGDGYVTHHGRANDLMKALGYRVAPQEVEAAIGQHPAVAEVACAEARVREDLSVIAAFVVLRDHMQATKEEIIAFASARLAAYKTPREVVFLEHLPRAPNGKLLRRELRLPAKASAEK
jgi:acyl-coenzyme A synthetase/AMP-(fatty) acid ligase